MWKKIFGKEKKKILVMADTEGWTIDQKAKKLIRDKRVKGYKYTLKYWTSTTPDQLRALIKGKDLVYFANWDIYQYIDIIKKREIPMVMGVDSFRYPDFVKELGKLVDLVIIPTKELKKDFPNAHLIYYSLGEQFYPRRDFVVGFSGKPDEYKGFPLIEQACKELGVTFSPSTGNRTYQQMADYYNSIDLLVVASINEGFCAPVIEALSMNVPVISTDVGVAREFEAVYKIERTVESIKAGIQRYFTGPRIQRDFSRATIHLEHKKVFDKLIAEYRKKQ